MSLRHALSSDHTECPYHYNIHITTQLWLDIVSMASNTKQNCHNFYWTITSFSRPFEAIQPLSIQYDILVALK